VQLKRRAKKKGGDKNKEKYLRTEGMLENQRKKTDRMICSRVFERTLRRF
jgi:hypothetical protein